MKCLQMPEFRLGGDSNKPWLDHLRDHGVVVLKGVLNSDEVSEAKKQYLEWLFGVAKLPEDADRNSQNCFANKYWASDCRGFPYKLGASHNSACWLVRTRPAIKQAFAAIWDTDDLIVSLDVPIAWRQWPKAVNDEDWLPKTEGLHCDQNPFHKKGLKCVQGMVPLYPVTAGIGGLEVVPGSNTDEGQETLRKENSNAQMYMDDWVVMSSRSSFRGKG